MSHDQNQSYGKDKTRRAILAVAGATGVGAFAATAAARQPGALKAAMWVSGTIVEVESPVAGMMRRADGTYITGNLATNVWFHFPLTTPVILDGIRPRLISIFILYNAVAARIINLHLFDGPRRVKEFDGLDLTGDHAGGIDQTNQWHPEPPLQIAFSLGISVHVDFANAGLEQLRIVFHSVGADFQLP